MARAGGTRAKSDGASERAGAANPNGEESKERNAPEPARRRRSARNFPAAPFEEALAFAKQVFEFGSGEPVRRLSLFDHIGKAPESGPSRQMIVTAGRYALIKGGYQSDVIELTLDGVRSVDPHAPKRDQASARIKLAVEDIEVFARLHERFIGKALPARAALVDSATEFGAPREVAEEAIDTFIVNLRFVGLLKTLSGADRIVSKEHALEEHPALDSALKELPLTSNRTAIITATHAHYETTCFYVAPIGSPESEQRKHSDLFLGSLIEPALEAFRLSVVRADKIDKPGVITKQILNTSSSLVWS